jgi:hypothetical protein
VEIFGKDFFQFHNSKREKKSLSSSDFVTAAHLVHQDIVQQSTKSEVRNHERWLAHRRGRLPLAVPRFARLRRLIYTSHSPCSHYCTD